MNLLSIHPRPLNPHLIFELQTEFRTQVLPDVLPGRSQLCTPLNQVLGPRHSYSLHSPEQHRYRGSAHRQPCRYPCPAVFRRLNHQHTPHSCRLGCGCESGKFCGAGNVPSGYSLTNVRRRFSRICSASFLFSFGK